jgi:ABC-type glycerol-3-phosphate transport system permease component
LDVSPEGIAHGYTHCFLLTFASATDRDAFPAHQAFVASLQPVLEQALVIDYWAAAPLGPSQLATRMAALPTAVIYILLGRFFIRGILAGSVKG